MRTKLYLILGLFFSFSVTSIAQSRENRQTPTFEKKSLKIEKVVGWCYNSTSGKWIENENVILDRNCSTYWVSHVEQGFKWIQFATLSYKGVRYYALLWEKVSGEYKYPNIQEDWEIDDRTCFFVIDSAQFLKLQNQIKAKQQKDLLFKSNIFGYITDRYATLGGEYLYNEENLISKIVGVINKPDYFENAFMVNSQQVDGKDVVRFKLPKNMYGSDNLKDSYFEIEKEDFEKIFTF